LVRPAINLTQLRVWLAATLLLLAAPTGVCAQDLVEPRGEGTVSFTFQNYAVAGHFDALGHKNNNGGTHSDAIVTEIDYGVTDSFGVTVSLPFIASKYTGPPVYFVGGHETHPGPLDDGTYHSALQDFRIEVRRMFWAGSVAIAPLANISFPSHDYETRGEAVPGRHRRDYQVGASFGTDLDRVVPHAYLEGRYAFGWAQQINDIPFTRSMMDLEFGHMTTSRLTLRALINWQIRHDGPAVSELLDDWEDHDRFIAPSFLNLGGGGTVMVNRSLDIYAVVLGTVRGSNGAHRGRLIAAGMSWGFGRGVPLG